MPQEISQALIDEIKNAFFDFNPESCNKKAIREMRKLLQKLSLAKYPKKARKAKTE